MNNGSGVSRGDRNRNARLSRLRAAVPTTNAIVGIELADRKQMLPGLFGHTSGGTRRLWRPVRSAGPGAGVLVVAPGRAGSVSRWWPGR